MKLIKSYLVNNPYYKVNENKSDSRYVTFQKRGPQGLMLHSVGCAQPDATVFVKCFNQTSYDSACVHAFIDGNTGTVYQTMPWNYRAPHCGGDANNTHIGVEMCEPAGISYGGGATFTVKDRTEAVACVRRTYKAAVELFAQLCEEYNLNPMTAIISHAEGYKKGVASGHGDPEHLWSGLGIGYTMDTFRAAVQAAMSGQTTNTTVSETQTASVATVKYRVRKTWNDNSSQIGAFADLDKAKAMANANPGYYVFDSKWNCVYPTTTAAAPKAIGSISYYKYTAGSTAVSVYADTTLKDVVGHLNAGESCYAIEAGSSLVACWYKLDDGSGWKIGYAKRSDGTLG